MSFGEDLLESARRRDQDRIDAARYRYLRRQHWNEAKLCVVANPKEAVRLGHDCPSFDRLDILVDEAMRTSGKGDEN